MHTTAARYAQASAVVVASLFVLGLGAADARFNQPKQGKLPPSAQQSKVAEGEYTILESENGGAIGPFGEEIYNFHETWTVSRLADGSYQVDGERRFESPKQAAHVDRFIVQLSRDLTITRITEFARLKWRRDSGPLTCEFLLSALHCSSNAKNADQSLELNIPMQKPFALLWPISAFSLSGLARQAERDLSHPTPVELVSIQQPSPEIPVSPMIQEGDLRYLGEENLNVAGQTRRAFKFSIKVALYPELIVWTSPKGLLLAVALRPEAKDLPEEAMKLVRLQESPGFE